MDSDKDTKESTISFTRRLLKIAKRITPCFHKKPFDPRIVQK